MIFYLNTIYWASFLCTDLQFVLQTAVLLLLFKRAFSDGHCPSYMWRCKEYVFTYIFSHLPFHVLDKFLQCGIAGSNKVHDLHCSTYCQWPSRNSVLTTLPPDVHKRVTSPTPLPTLDIINLFNFCQTDRQRPISNFVIIYIRTAVSKSRPRCVFCSKWLCRLALGTFPYSQPFPCSSVYCCHCWTFAEVSSPS